MPSRARRTARRITRKEVVVRRRRLQVSHTGIWCGTIFLHEGTSRGMHAALKPWDGQIVELVVRPAR